MASIPLFFRRPISKHRKWNAAIFGKRSGKSSTTWWTNSSKDTGRSRKTATTIRANSGETNSRTILRTIRAESGEKGRVVRRCDVGRDRSVIWRHYPVITLISRQCDGPWLTRTRTQERLWLPSARDVGTVSHFGKSNLNNMVVILFQMDKFPMRTWRCIWFSGKKTNNGDYILRNVRKVAEN